MKEKIANFYDKNYKKLLIVPVIIFIFSVAVIMGHYVQTGEFIEKGVSLKGGSTLTIQLNTPVDVDIAQEQMRQLTTQDLNVKEFSSAGTRLGIIVETTALEVNFIKDFVNENYDVKTITVETIGPSLGESFFKQALIAVLIAFVLMGLVVFAYFRLPMPSLYIIFSAVADIFFAWAILVLTNIRLSTAGIAALLMLIGYSVDTDILLTTRVLKRHGLITEKIFGAMGTGSVMTLTAMTATGIAFLVTPSEVLKQIMLILFLGLSADLWNTWLLNAGLLKMYLEKKHRQNG